MLDTASEFPTFTDMASDALSDLLKTVRLTGATFFDVVARNPWVAEQPTREMVLPKVLPGATHLISYHVITEGRCYAERAVVILRFWEDLSESSIAETLGCPAGTVKSTLHRALNRLRRELRS